MVEPSLQIGPYRLHPVQGLSLGGREVRVTPKSLAVLAALARQPGRIVTKQDLFRTVWAGTVVTEAALSTCIRELRRALDDDARKPRYIETVHRRGFRLLVNGNDHRAGQRLGIAPWAARQPIDALPGRAGVIRRLEELAGRVGESGAQVALITGPSGVGKSALLRCFAARMSSRGAWLVCEAKCTEPMDAYGPLLHVLDQLRQGPGSVAIGSILRDQARSWLAELPGSHAGSRHTVPDWGSGATAQWRFRELRDALAAVTGKSPLIICLDDLHQCDEGTLAFILHFACDPGPARVLLMGSWEVDPTEADGQLPEVFRELRGTGRCSKFVLGALDARAVAECLQARFSGIEADRRDRLAEELVRHTRGSALMVEAALDQWVSTDSPEARSQRQTDRLTRAARSAAAPGLPELIRQRLDRLSETERSALEAASVVGERFSAAEVAAATGGALDNTTDALMRSVNESGLISEQGIRTLPDGGRTGAFAFLHAQYRVAVGERLGNPYRVDLHRRVGHWMQRAWAGRTDRVAARIARHFERAGELDDAARHWYEAGAVARRRGAHGIALKCFRRAQALLENLPQAPGRELLAAKLATALGRELVITQGLHSPEANGCYRRALELSVRVPACKELAQVLWRLWVFHLNRGPLETAGELADRLLGLARQLDDAALLVQAHHAQWGTSFMRGDLPAVLEHTRQGISVCGSGVQGSMALTAGCTLHDAHLSDHSVAICAGFFSAWADALGGRQDSAIRSLDAAITHARDVRHAFTLCLALVMSAGALAATGNAGLTRLRAAEGRGLARQHGFTALVAWAAIYEGWALVELGDADEGMDLLHNGLSSVGEFGMKLFRPFHLALAAAAQMRCERLDDASRSLDEAFAVSEESGHRFAVSEMLRLRGELGLRTDGDRDSRRRAVTDLKAAAQIAGATGARLWKNRANAALAAQSLKRKFDAIADDQDQPPKTLFG